MKYLLYLRYLQYSLAWYPR